MPYSARRVHPSELTGPRSYFTDLDPADLNFEASTVERKLKLQLLTKEKVVIAASSLFHDTGLEFCRQDKGLIEALEKGILLPAMALLHEYKYVWMNHGKFQLPQQNLL